MKLSKPSHLSKSVFIFFLSMGVWTCQQKEVQHKQVDTALPDLEQKQENAVNVYMPLQDGTISKPIEYTPTSGNGDLGEIVDEVLRFMSTYQAEPVIASYASVSGCVYKFGHKTHIYLECSGLKPGDMNLADEKRIFYALLATLLGLDKVEKITFFKGQQYADVFADDLILPKIIDRDFMDALGKHIAHAKVSK